LTSVKVRSRRDPFLDKVKTKIWKELSKEPQGYIAEQATCYGYPLLELIQAGYSQTDITYLLLSGNLPSLHQRQLLDALSIAICNPGPRHPATRAVMESAVSKTRSPNYLPIGLMVLSGTNSAASVEAIMRFLRLNKRKTHPEFSEVLISNYIGPENDNEIAPGFGPHFEQREPLFINLAKLIRKTFKETPLKYLDWCLAFDDSLSETCCGMKSTALAASIFLDLGFHPRIGPGLYQLLSAPGLLAHGIEMMGQPLSAMPFVADEHYHYVGDGL
jgi:citrate synthase